MRNVLIFGEDCGHEVALRTLLDRLAAEYQVPLKVQVRSSVGGHGRTIGELTAFLSELQRDRAALPDLFVVARDANCLGCADRVSRLRRSSRGNWLRAEKADPSLTHLLRDHRVAFQRWKSQ